jgi:phage repressor protein C with HTH and peptisase S24 domain
MATYTPESVHERLELLLKELDITPYQLAKELGEQPTKLYNILNGKATPSYSTLKSIVDKYPKINLNWLFGGEGEMTIKSNAKMIDMSGNRFIDYPFVPIRFYGSFIGQYTDSFQSESMDTYRVALSPNEPIYKSAFVVEVEGNSMSPRIGHGSKILITEVAPADWAYSSGVYAVMFKDFFVVKRIKDNELLTKNHLMLHSDNPESGSMLIHGKDLRAMWKVVKIVEAPVD